MIERDSTQSAPPAPPHYEFLSHPLIHDPHSPSYLGCLDILHNAAYLLELFQHLNLDETSSSGGLSSDANEAFFWLAKMLENTLYYVGKTLEEAWGKREAHPAEEQFRQSSFLKAIREPAGSSQSQTYSIIASCLGISPADVQAFVAIIEGQPNNASDAQVGRA